MDEANGGMAGKSPLVLIVEDERDIADMLEDYFGIEGYRTLVAGDAASAVEPFWRGADDRAASAGGACSHLGLGLYVCSVLCARHGGSLAVGDREGGGAVAAATFAAPVAE